MYGGSESSLDLIPFHFQLIGYTAMATFFELTNDSGCHFFGDNLTDEN
jgi:hypothetical protein